MLSEPLIPEHTFNGALVVFVISVAGLTWAALRRLRPEAPSISLWCTLAFGSLALVTFDYLRWIGVVLSIGSALTYWHSTQRSTDHAPTSTRFTLLFFSASSYLAIAFLLLYRLVPNYSIPLVWEGTVILNYLTELQTFDVGKALGARLLWAEGLFSEGDLSLLYGFPTALLLTIHSSLLSLRIFSVVYCLGAAALLALICRRFSNCHISATVVAIFGLNELILIFGRYGSSIAGTIFGILVALLACGSLVARPSVLRALWALAALFVATLGYAPARLVVVLLVAGTIIGILVHRTIAQRTKILVIGVFCSGALLCGGMQKSFGRLDAFASARQEQVFYLFVSGTWPEQLTEQWENFKAENRPPTPSDYISFTKNLISSTTLHELQTLLSPFTKASPLSRHFYSDPIFLELYAPYLFPFLILGSLMCARRSSRWFQGIMIGWVAVSTVPILLTNRVDSYRASMLLVPFSVWIAVGISEVVSELRRIKFPAPLLVIVLTGSLCAIAVSRVEQLSAQDVQPALTDTIIESLEPRFLHQAIIGVEGQGFRSAAQTKLLLLRRHQQRVPAPARVLPLKEYESLLSNGDVDARRQTLDHISSALSQGAFAVLGPRSQMKETLSQLQQQGYRVYTDTNNNTEYALVGR